VKVLLDECVDRRLAAHLRSFEVVTVAAQGWNGITNGKLLTLAESEFDVFVTVDRNLAFQQHLPKFSIAVVLLAARTNRIADLVALVPELIQTIPVAQRGVVTKVGP
jgi:Domain of unknown function (DUF5615)